MWDRIVFLLNRLGERLWIRPLISCVLSVAAAFIAKAADSLDVIRGIPNPRFWERLSFRLSP